MKTTMKSAMAAAVLALALIGCSSSGNDDVRSTPNTNEGGTSAPADSIDAGGGDESTTTEATTTTTEPEPAAPAAAQASDFVGGNIDPAFGPGEPGQLSVIAVGSPNGELDSVPFVVRNNTTAPVYNVAATGRATNGGQLVGSGEDQGVEPATVAPGEIAFGYVYFSATPPAGATIEVTATADSENDTIFGSVPMTIGTANLVPGDFGTQIVGEVTAPADVEVSGPVNVLVLCVDAAGTVTRTLSGYTDGSASVLPGATATYTVDDYENECPTFLIGSSGYTA